MSDETNTDPAGDAPVVPPVVDIAGTVAAILGTDSGSGFAGDGGVMPEASVGSSRALGALGARFPELVPLAYVTDADREDPEFSAYFDAWDRAQEDRLAVFIREAEQADQAARDHAAAERKSVEAEARGGKAVRVPKWDAAAADRAAQVRAVRAADVARDINRARRQLPAAGDALAHVVRGRAVESARVSAATVSDALRTAQGAYATHTAAVEAVTGLDRRAARAVSDANLRALRLSAVEASRAKAEGLRPASFARVPRGGEGRLWESLGKSVWSGAALDALAVAPVLPDAVPVKGQRVMPSSGLNIPPAGRRSHVETAHGNVVRNHYA